MAATVGLTAGHSIICGSSNDEADEAEEARPDLTVAVAMVELLCCMVGRQLSWDGCDRQEGGPAGRVVRGAWERGSSQALAPPMAARLASRPSSGSAAAPAVRTRLQRNVAVSYQTVERK
jgi:hypothetical protein